MEFFSNLSFILIFYLNAFKIFESSPCTHSARCNEEGPLCSSDGVTYINRCEFEADLCNSNLNSRQIIFKGLCSKCLLDRVSNQKFNSTKIKSNTFIPQCDVETALYLPTQCHQATGYCWCVNIHTGKPVPGTSFQVKSLIIKNCDEIAQKISSKQINKRLGDKKCTRFDKLEFNRNIMEAFEIEYKRMIQDRYPNIQKIVEWKFFTLDENKDGKINQKEIKEFKNLIQNSMVRQRVCGRNFFRLNDLNSDNYISKAEWNYYFFGDQEKYNLRKHEAVFRNSPSSLIDFLPYLDSLRLFSKFKNESEVKKEDKFLKEEELDSVEMKANCTETRITALKNSRKYSRIKNFIPDCNEKTPHLYAEVQCHQATGYCWCVKVDNGHPIGVALYKSKPKCQPKISQLNHTLIKKKCSDNKKNRFLKFLFNHFREEVKTELRLDQINNSQLIFEKKFQKLDHNGNQKLERKEWAKFRKSLLSIVNDHQIFKKCAKKLIKNDCDLNHDLEIDNREWLKCTSFLNITTSRNSKSKFKRKGPNPFSTILKAD